MTKRIATSTLAALALAGCAISMDEKSPSYNMGFDDGCATANAETAAIDRPPMRDTGLYATDLDYRSGWLTGHATCQTQFNATFRR
jgi:hypothetical protein